LERVGGWQGFETAIRWQSSERVGSWQGMLEGVRAHEMGGK
jgi:hypothetical protein